MSFYIIGNHLYLQLPPTTAQYTPDLTRAETRPTMKKQVPPADLALFHEQVQDAQPLREAGIEPYRRRPPPIPRPRPLELPEDAGVTLSESEVETHECLSFARPEIGRAHV